MIMIWGILVTMHAACDDVGKLAAVRFLLGAIEVCTAPTAIYIIGSFYTKQEQITRVAIWYTASEWANVVGGFLAWCIHRLLASGGKRCSFFMALLPSALAESSFSSSLPPRQMLNDLLWMKKP
jgi:MFS family permease